MSTQSFTAIVHKEGNVWVSHCPELDVASHGESIEGAKGALKEAVELFLESASAEEIQHRLEGTHLSRLEVNVA